MLFILLISNLLNASEPVRVAVASNFRQAAELLAADFQSHTGYVLVMSYASSGKHYAQIRHGAPYSVFLSADQTRPRQLESDGVVVPGSRKVYAIGQLMLISSDPELDAAACQTRFRDGDFRHLAIANPQHAPYGQAAMEVLGNLELGASASRRLIVGENVAQAYHFVASGNADMGFIAKSQVLVAKAPSVGCQWPVPAEMYRPILQEAVLLNAAADDPGAATFHEYLFSPGARAIIQAAGYALPAQQE